MVIGTSCYCSASKWAITVKIPEIHIISQRNINFLLLSHMISWILRQKSISGEDNDYDNAALDRVEQRRGENNNIKVNTMLTVISVISAPPSPIIPGHWCPLLGQWHWNYLIVTQHWSRVIRCTAHCFALIVTLKYFSHRQWPASSQLANSQSHVPGSQHCHHNGLRS